MSGAEQLPLRPQVITRGEKYALININLDSLDELQRLGIAARVWDQVRFLMEANGTYRARDPHIIGSSAVGKTEDIDAVVAELVNISWSTLGRVRPRLLQRADVVEKLVNGEYESFKDVAVDLGMKVTISFFKGGVKSRSSTPTSHFGQGDKFDIVTSSLRSYLRAWKKKNFRYAHVNPKEAQKRVKVLDEILADLQTAREDLVNRSHVATYRVPSERRENK